jgi:hypothetical protein
VVDEAPPSRTTTVVVVIVVVAAVLVGSWAYLARPKPSVTPGPTTLLPEGAGQATPGSPGCRSIPGNVCVHEQFAPLVRGINDSSLSFAVANPEVPAYPVRSDVELGPGASIALFTGAPSAPGVWNATGVWNYTLGAWSLAPTGNLSSTSQFTVVLDTGLTSDATLQNATFWVELGPPNQTLDGLELDGV